MLTDRRIKNFYLYHYYNMVHDIEVILLARFRAVLHVFHATLKTSIKHGLIATAFLIMITNCSRREYEALPSLLSTSDYDLSENKASDPRNSGRFARYVIDLIWSNGTKLTHKYPCIFWCQIEAIVQLRKALCYQWTQDETVSEASSFISFYHGLFD